MSQSGIIRSLNTDAVSRRLEAMRRSYQAVTIRASVRGPLLTLAAAVMFDTLARYGVAVPTPFTVLLLTVLYAAASGGIESHRLTTMPIRTSALRTLGAQGNVFAIESVLDEIATERGEDPVAFRLRHLKDERARDVIRAVAKRAGWKPDKQPGIGHGIAFARYKNTGAYCAAVAEIEGEADIRVRKLTLAVDVGEAINPDGVINQIEGGAIQATSWVLKERVRFDRQRITSTSWTEYPILRFSEVPEIEVELIQRSEIDPVGAGEAAHGPVTAAIANAVFDALGVRVRQLPITRETIIAAVESTS